MTDQLLKRLDSIIDRVERDVPIDFQKEANLLALDTVRSSLLHTQEAIQRTKDADERLGNVNEG